MNLLISVTTVRKALTSISKHWLLYVIKIGVAVLVMTVLITVIKPVVIYQAVIQANQLFVLLACLLVFPNLYVQFKKWRYLVCLVKPDVTHSDVWRSLLIGFTFGFITPGRIGEYGRAFFIKDSSWERILGVTILDKLFSMSAS